MSRLQGLLACLALAAAASLVFAATVCHAEKYDFDDDFYSE